MSSRIGGRYIRIHLRTINQHPLGIQTEREVDIQSGTPETKGLKPPQYTDTNYILVEKIQDPVGLN